MIDDSANRLRRELIEWFRKRASALADAYEGAVRLLDNRDLPGRSRFIAHALRDICDRLPFVLDPQQEGRRVQYEDYLDKIQKDWPLLDNLHDSDGVVDGENVKISRKVASRIHKLVKEHRKRRERPSNGELLFRFFMRENPSKAEVDSRLVKDFNSMRKWFMDEAHFCAQISPPVDEYRLGVEFKRFERMLHCFVGEFFTGTKELDEILRQANE